MIQKRGEQMTTPTDGPTDINNSNEMRESRLRSFLKALTWRIVATLTTIVIAFLVVGEVAVAVAIGGIEFFAKFIIYYLHERAWQIVPRGTVRQWVRSEE